MLIVMCAHVLVCGCNNADAHQGESPLFSACTSGSVEAVQWLVARGADPLYDTDYVRVGDYDSPRFCGRSIVCVMFATIQSGTSPFANAIIGRNVPVVAWMLAEGRVPINMHMRMWVPGPEELEAVSNCCVPWPPVSLLCATYSPWALSFVVHALVAQAASDLYVYLPAGHDVDVAGRVAEIWLLEEHVQSSPPHGRLCFDGHRIPCGCARGFVTLMCIKFES